MNLCRLPPFVQYFRRSLHRTASDPSCLGVYRRYGISRW